MPPVKNSKNRAVWTLAPKRFSARWTVGLFRIFYGGVISISNHHPFDLVESDFFGARSLSCVMRVEA